MAVQVFGDNYQAIKRISFADYVFKIQSEACITTEELCSAMNIEPVMLEYYMNDYVKPSPSLIWRLIDAFAIHPFDEDKLEVRYDEYTDLKKAVGGAYCFGFPLGENSFGIFRVKENFSDDDVLCVSIDGGESKAVRLNTDGENKVLTVYGDETAKTAIPADEFSRRVRVAGKMIKLVCGFEEK